MSNAWFPYFYACMVHACMVPLFLCIHGSPISMHVWFSYSYMVMALRYAPVWAAEAPLLTESKYRNFKSRVVPGGKERDWDWKEINIYYIFPLETKRSTEDKKSPVCFRLQHGALIFLTTLWLNKFLGSTGYTINNNINSDKTKKQNVYTAKIEEFHCWYHRSYFPLSVL